jgi:hypothetical protein
MGRTLIKLVKPQGKSSGTRAHCLGAIPVYIYAVFLGSPGACGQQAPSAPSANSPARDETPAGDWAPQLLYDVWNSPNPEASEALYRAAFAAGSDTVPELEAALKDDRTAEFAAQALAFIGGPRAFEILSKLAEDRRDLNLRRFFYGALGESDAAESTRLLLDVIRRSDGEPDRTVTETAIIALTVHTDLNLVPALREAESQLKDYVIRDDLENAITVIQARAHYLSSPEGKKAGTSVEQVVHTYFIPALEPPAERPAASPKTSGQAAKPQNQRATRTTSSVIVKVQQLTFSPDKARALAHVMFEDPAAVAEYDMVLQKKFGDWTLASVWLGPEYEKPLPGSSPESSKQP